LCDLPNLREVTYFIGNLYVYVSTASGKLKVYRIIAAIAVAVNSDSIFIF
jgi:hypothetical protein